MILPVLCLGALLLSEAPDTSAAEGGAAQVQHPRRDKRQDARMAGFLDDQADAAAVQNPERAKLLYRHALQIAPPNSAAARRARAGLRR